MRRDRCENILLSLHQPGYLEARPGENRPLPGHTSLAEARLKLQQLKQIRRQGRCPGTEAREQKREEQKKQAQEQKQARVAPVQKPFTVQDLVELYLTQYIEDRKSTNGRNIAGARKPKGQSETRRTLYGDVVSGLGEMPADAVTRKHVEDMVMTIVQRGANVQAGNVLRELAAAYEFAIGLGYFQMTLQTRRFWPKQASGRPGSN